MLTQSLKQPKGKILHPIFRSALWLMIIVAAVVYVTEILVMLLLGISPFFSPFLEAIIDSSLLLIFIFPALYFFFFRPMLQHIHERRMAENELQNERDTLDERVKERSEELVVINRELESEIAIRRKAEEHLRKFSMIAEQSPNSIIITEAEGNIEFINPKFAELTGYTFEEVVGKNPRILQSGKTNAETYKKMWDTIRVQQTWKGEIQDKKKNGELYWASVSISPVTNEQKEITHYLGIQVDITAKKEAEEERERLIAELRTALSEVKTLEGLLPICAWCKKIRDEKGYWTQVEEYIAHNTTATFTHGICKECAETQFKRK